MAFRNTKVSAVRDDATKEAVIGNSLFLGKKKDKSNLFLNGKEDEGGLSLAKEEVVGAFRYNTFELLVTTLELKDCDGRILSFEKEEMEKDLSQPCREEV